MFRGAGYLFGSEVVKKFLHLNNVIHICRAHQLCMAGYNVIFDDTLSTVWSAPNYGYTAGNRASVLEIDTKLNRFWNLYDAAPEQLRKPIPRRKTPDYFL
jgi:serine/threonine-protein phosphatase PPG1